MSGRDKTGRDGTTYAQLAAVSAIWGGTFVAGRFLAGDVPPLVLASVRFVLASATLAAYLLLARQPLLRPTGRQLLHLAVLGFFGIFLYNLFFFYGLERINASRASLIVALNPGVIALLSHVLAKEQLTPIRAFGVLLCVAGAGMVIISRDGDVLRDAPGIGLGDVLILGCVASWVIYSVFSPRLSDALGPLLTVSYSVWIGTAMLCGAALATTAGSVSALSNISTAQFLSLLYLGAIGSAAAYVWYYDGIRRIGATRAGTFIALNPATAVLASAVLLGEPLDRSILLGAALTMSGIYLCSRR